MSSLSLRVAVLAAAFVFAVASPMTQESKPSPKKGFELTSVLPQFPNHLYLEGLRVFQDDQWTDQHWRTEANATFVGLDRLNAVLDGPLCGVAEEQYGLTFLVPNLTIRGHLDGDVLWSTCSWPISCYDNYYIGGGDYEVIYGDDEKEDTIRMLARIRENPETGLVDVYEVDKWFSWSYLSDRASYGNVYGFWDGKPMDVEHFGSIGYYGFQMLVPLFTPSLRVILQEALKDMTLAQLHELTGGCP